MQRETKMFNRSEIMTLAWARAKAELWSMRAPASRLRGLFRAALAQAWADTKAYAARKLAEIAAWADKPVRSVAALQNAIFCAECKDRLSAADYDYIATLRRELKEAQRRDTLGAAL
jgi:hypothetical protein